MKTEERERARLLRRERGLSVKELARVLRVSRSTISLWVRDVELSDEQYARLKARSSWGRLSGSQTNAARGIARRANAQNEGRARARRGGAMYVAGCMLYWAEGARCRNRVLFVNSDPAMVEFFLRFLRLCYSVPDSKVRVTCNLFADHEDRQRDIEDFLAPIARPPADLLVQVDGQPVLEIQQEETAQQVALRNVPTNGLRHPARSKHLRCDPGIRRLRARGMGHVAA
jgi:hypothetical protein